MSPGTPAKRNPRLTLALGATLAFLALFGLGLAIAPDDSGKAAVATSDLPAVTIEPAPAAAAVKLGDVRTVGLLPVLRPKPKPKPSPAPNPPPGPAPPAGPPPAAPPPAAPPPAAPPPPPPPTCIGAGCGYK